MKIKKAIAQTVFFAFFAFCFSMVVYEAFLIGPLKLLGGFLVMSVGIVLIALVVFKLFQWLDV